MDKSLSRPRNITDISVVGPTLRAMSRSRAETIVEILLDAEEPSALITADPNSAKAAFSSYLLPNKADQVYEFIDQSPLHRELLLRLESYSTNLARDPHDEDDDPDVGVCAEDIQAALEDQRNVFRNRLSRLRNSHCIRIIEGENHEEILADLTRELKVALYQIFSEKPDVEVYRLWLNGILGQGQGVVNWLPVVKDPDDGQNYTAQAVGSLMELIEKHTPEEIIRLLVGEPPYLEVLNEESAL